MGAQHAAESLSRNPRSAKEAPARLVVIKIAVAMAMQMWIG